MLDRVPELEVHLASMRHLHDEYRRHGKLRLLPLLSMMIRAAEDELLDLPGPAGPRGIDSHPLYCR